MMVPANDAGSSWAIWYVVVPASRMMASRSPIIDTQARATRCFASESSRTLAAKSAFCPLALTALTPPCTTRTRPFWDSTRVSRRTVMSETANVSARSMVEMNPRRLELVQDGALAGRQRRLFT